MRIVRLNGELGKKYGRVHKLDVRTPGEAIRALCSNYPELKGDLIASTDKGVGYKCVVDKEQVGEDGLHYPMSRTFSITPVVAGAGKVAKIIVGTLLIAAAFILAPPVVGAMGPTLGMQTGIGFLGLTYANVAWIGAAIALSGVAQLLAPTPKMSDAQKRDNPAFDGAVNVTAQGAAVPVGYGRMIVGSAVISAAITVEQAPDPTTAYDFAMMGFAGGGIVV